MKILTYLKVFEYLHGPKTSNNMNLKKFYPCGMVAVLETTVTRFDGVGHLSYAGFLLPNRQIMSTNTLSKETELRLADFFNNSIDPQFMAKTIRQVNHLLALSLMRDCETLETDKTNLENGFYWLNELAEILNPYLDVE